MLTVLPVRSGPRGEITTRDEVTLRVARDVRGEPLGVSFAADHHEERGRGHVLDGVVGSIGKRERFEMPVARAADHLDPGPDYDVLVRSGSQPKRKPRSGRRLGDEGKPTTICSAVGVLADTAYSVEAIRGRLRARASSA